MIFDTPAIRRILGKDDEPDTRPIAELSLTDLRQRQADLKGQSERLMAQLKADGITADEYDRLRAELDGMIAQMELIAREERKRPQPGGNLF